MSNQSVAIKWAIEMSKNGQPVVSDQFFAPFSQKQKTVIKKKLIRKGVIPFDTSEVGSILVKRSALREYNKKNDYYAGVYQKGDNLMMLSGSLDS